MPDPLVVLLVVAQGAGTGSTTTSAASTLKGVAGRDTVVVVRELPRVPDPSAAPALAREAGAAVLVELSWLADRKNVAVLHVQEMARSRDSTREVAFSDRDESTERGRTLGIAIASMLPPPPVADLAPRAQVDAPPPSPAPSPPPSPSPPSTDARAKPAAAVPERPKANGPARMAIDVLASGALAIGAQGSGAGGAVGLVLPLTSAFGVRVGGAFASATSGVGDAAATYGALSAGAFYVIAASREGRISCALRSDLLAIRVGVSHRGEPSPSRWIPGVDVLASVSVALGAHLAVPVEAGAEASLGRTRILANGQPVAELAALRAVGRIGVRLVF